MQQAYYCAKVASFVQEAPQTILGHLAEHHAHAVDPLQRNAWLNQINLLQRDLRNAGEGWIAFEFTIPRIGKRVDAILILAGIIFVIEFKVGAEQFTTAAIDQVVDYALDLKNFHAGSHERGLVPVLIATRAPSPAIQLSWNKDGVANPVLSNGAALDQLLTKIVQQAPQQLPLLAEVWAASSYKPTPTIVEAAQALYRGHRVEDITRADAGAKNLDQTTACLSAIIERAKTRNHKAICFVTGVPGAGKTLAGLNLVTQRTKAHGDENAVFLSGNGPLVAVLREALARDEQAQSKEADQEIRKNDAIRKVQSFIQNIHHFRDANLLTDAAPVERVAVFDEAQRAWDLKQASKFMAQKRGVSDFNMSEPEFLIGVMDRHADWCTIVCLVGGGQEINAGEAGLTEWFNALKRRFSSWKVYTSPELIHRDYHWGQNLPEMLAGSDCQKLADLHLAISIRSFRAEKLSEFVSALIAGEADIARALYGEIKSSYPIVLTRDLHQAKAWLRRKARGSERFGLVASSGASRLKPEGINVHEKISAIYWFLNDKNDVRSSYYLEDPATEFDIQGLELDWVGLCWDADFRFINDRWSHHSFRGTTWQNIGIEHQRAYLANAYRVLLTRARQGMVIYVPVGDPTDPTRLPQFYDGILAFLQTCGIEMLAPSNLGRINAGLDHFASESARKREAGQGAVA
jgi:hypothetical protein